MHTTIVQLAESLTRVMTPVSPVIKSMCTICSSFTDEQKKKHNKRKYVRKQKTVVDTSKDELDLLGDEFSGSQADLEGASNILFSSAPRPQTLHFESLSMKTPQAFSPTPGTVLQKQIETTLGKSLDTTLNLQIQQQIWVFQAFILEAMQFLRNKFKTMH